MNFHRMPLVALAVATTLVVPGCGIGPRGGYRLGYLDGADSGVVLGVMSRALLGQWADLPHHQSVGLAIDGTLSWANQRGTWELSGGGGPTGVYAFEESGEAVGSWTLSLNLTFNYGPAGFGIQTALCGERFDLFVDQPFSFGPCIRWDPGGWIGLDANALWYAHPNSFR
ncbi:hypothetical protein ACFL6C_04955 [Myxococcota bacterium]